MPVIPFQIQIQNLSKSFHRSVLFRQLNFTLLPGYRLFITGSNGAGKSTFLKVFAGKLKADTGSIVIIKGKKRVSSEYFFKHIAWDAPYIHLYPYFTVEETFYWHFQFYEPLLTFKEWIKILQLKSFENQELKYLSSGTLQRVKVGLALFSKTPILILDEPTANMDTNNAKHIIELIYQYSKERVLIIASNLLREIERNDQVLIENYLTENLNFHLYKQDGNSI